jgi:hypothetical protein
MSGWTLAVFCLSEKAKSAYQAGYTLFAALRAATTSTRISTRSWRSTSLSTLRVAITSYEEMKARTLAIARGQLKPGPQDPKVWFTSTESMARVLSAKNRALLETIRLKAPQSLTEVGRADWTEEAELIAHPKNHGALRLGSG